MEIKLSVSVEELFEIISKLSIKESTVESLVNQAKETVMTEVIDKSESKDKAIKEIKNKCEDKNENDDMITSIELQKLIGCSNQTIFNYCKRGMPYVRLDDGQKQYRFDKNKCLAWVSDYTKKRDAEKINNFKTKVSPKRHSNPVDKDSFATWQRNIFKAIDEKGLDRGKTCSEVFKYITKRYGVVWDQVKKDFYYDNNYSAPSTLQAVYWLQNNKSVYKDLFESCLDTILQSA